MILDFWVPVWIKSGSVMISKSHGPAMLLFDLFKSGVTDFIIIIIVSIIGIVTNRAFTNHKALTILKLMTTWTLICWTHVFTSSFARSLRKQNNSGESRC
eukprot:TRINITY_DN5328_c0_g2_i1.p1 TRINITY_DN5328_c0_g2~~TRINITY_DN5328_c0_g2_i1.p1  ORF type:complete len:100 (-),score=5.97 TRINITY_DN5328_c0_g2_i1:421-720(-)